MTSEKVCKYMIHQTCDFELDNKESRVIKRLGLETWQPLPRNVMFGRGKTLIRQDLLFLLLIFSIFMWRGLLTSSMLVYSLIIIYYIDKPVVVEIF